MSRETDSPSSGPHGRGGAAYPSGTPPYGTPAASDAGAPADRPAARPEDRKTETTLTTRIRINIPGSRPIPPVVMRKPVADADGAEGGPTGSGTTAETPAPAAPAPTGGAEAAAEPVPSAPSAEDRAPSDWFAPRKSAPGSPGQGGGSADGSGPGAPAPAGGTPAAGAGTGPRPAGASRPSGVTGALGTSAGSRGGSALTGATGGPVAPGHGGGTGSFDVTEALSVGPLGGGARPGHEPRGEDLAFFPEPGDERGAGDPQGFHGTGTAAPGAPGGPRADDRPPFGTVPGTPQAPAGPTGGPATGAGPLAPSPAGEPGPPGGPRLPGTAPGPGADAPRPGPGGGLSDDTAILTPQIQAGLAGAARHGAPGPAAGNAFTGDSPPAERKSPFQAVPPPPGGPGPSETAAAPAPARGAAAAPARKKGRSKLALLVGGVLFVAGVTYGAGLLMNRSDVPKGTTVLGVDIGGGTRDDAVQKLGDTLGTRAAKPLELAVDGGTVPLRPDQAGLQFDAQATASAAARSDYNPVSVIGSLFGRQRVVDPVMPVDEEKLHAALRDAAGASGSVTEGTITFEAGRAVAVYGKPGKGIDVAGSTDAVERAYRAQVETGASAPVNVPTTARQPEVSNAEVDRMMKEYARPAMSGFVSVRTDAAHRIEFSPQNSLWKFLRVKAVDGRLVDAPDLKALEELYGGTFEGVEITRGTGKKTAVTPQDVYGALRQALLSTDARDAVIDTDPS
ncbi:hypothetical protein [Streptomyces sp. SHP 1-2]|uniref:hypothetical protein n=1 Tax=Streptomyces sp. SHP 1-2 TaxID=2769489 RepID=UPI0022385EB2|nr:hypothetical protein [Streptomyces sp. SHP 1-2]MCW5253263.1 hypothetical protein [Streptomyces sp. SHP 1-2]